MNDETRKKLGKKTNNFFWWIQNLHIVELPMILDKCIFVHRLETKYEEDFPFSEWSKKPSKDSLHTNSLLSYFTTLAQ